MTWKQATRRLTLTSKAAEVDADDAVAGDGA